jgi:hypothetical protein
LWLEQLRDAILRHNTTVTDPEAKWDANDFPRIMIGDSSQVNEATLVIIDGAMEDGDAPSLGHTRTEERINVYLTRAKVAVVVLGRHLAGYKAKGDVCDTNPAIAAFHKECVINEAYIPACRCGYYVPGQSQQHAPFVPDDEISDA